MIRIIQETKSGILQGYASTKVVIANKAEASGLIKANALGISVETIVSKDKTREEFEKLLIECLESYKIDYIILAGFMKILSSKFVMHYNKRIINIHPADTSLHQGINAYKWAFETKRKETTITVHFVDEGIDTGRVIDRKTVDLSGVKSIKDVEERGLKTEHILYSRAIKKLFISEGVVPCAE